MAHELDFSTGQAAIALVGGAKTAWHGFGQEILATDSLADIQKKAGCLWNAKVAQMQFRAEKKTHIVDGRHIVYRDDTLAPIGEVSGDRYHIVQPGEVFQFFSDFLKSNDLSIETAGALRGGRIVWCLAKMKSDDFQMRLGRGGKDVIDSYIRLQTSFDCTLATSLVATTIRQVCANTMQMIEGATERTQYRTPHTVKFNAKHLQQAFGMVGDKYKMTAQFYNELIKTKVTEKQVNGFFADLIDIELTDLGKTDRHGDKLVSTQAENVMKTLLECYNTGPGADLSTAKGTAFGLLQAVTYWADHKATCRDTFGDGKAAAAINSAWFGANNKTKIKAQMLAAELAECSELLAA